MNFIGAKLKKFDTNYPETSKTIQLTFIYFFSIIDLIHSVLNSIFSAGISPKIFKGFLPLINSFLESPILKFFSSPEKVFFMSYIVLEVMVVRSTLNFSKFIKYNILLVFALLMLQGLVLSILDLLFNRSISNLISNLTSDSELAIGTSEGMALFFFFFTFIIFFILYIHFYSNSLKGKIKSFKGFNWVTDSVAFWLKIKTPTMQNKDRNENNDN